MNISSSATGLYPALLPAVRRPAVAVSDKDVVSSIATSTEQAVNESSSEQLFASDKNITGLDVGGLTQPFNGLLNRYAGESATGNTVTSAAQRAVTEYANVATQEHREELVSLLGIDVFA